MELYRKLNTEEEKEFRQWARDNYTPLSKINEAWHPVVREECEEINRQNKVGKDFDKFFDDLNTDIFSKFK